MFSRKMPVFVKVLSGAVGLAGISAGAIQVTRPDVLVEIASNWQRYRVGLRRKNIELDDGFRMCYAERGRTQQGIPTMVMLHGFSGSLDAAVPVVKKLPADMHVIAIDAPGHGKTKHISDDDLRLQVMAQRLNQFIKKKHLDEEGLHLVGWAMGGTIAGFYAAQYPDGLKLLTLATPGMYCPVKSPAMQETIDGDTHVLLPVSEEEQKRLWKILLYKNNDLPKPVRDYLHRKKLKRREDHFKVLKNIIEEAMSKEDNLYVNKVQNIRTPTQIIWGNKDELEHVSGADLLASTIGYSVKRKDIVSECGHAFYVEEPCTLASLLVAFQVDYRLKRNEWEAEKPAADSKIKQPPEKDPKIQRLPVPTQVVS